MNKESYSPRRAFQNGMRDGIPIGLGYFAVAFSLGIAAKNAGITPLQTAVMSLLCNASAGQYAGISVIAANGGYLEMALYIFIANIRYMLMSIAMSQRVSPELPLRHRIGMSYDLTDELFGIAIARPGYLIPQYTYGAMLTAMPMWALGSMLGCLAGELLPAALVAALSVSLFGMFIAIVIPQGKKDKVVLGVIFVCFVMSWAFSKLSFTASLSGGTRAVILSVVISLGAAILFPHKEETNDAA